MISNHHRNTTNMLSSPRCGAKTRSGKPCMAPAVAGKKGAGCTVVRLDRVHHAATETR